MADENPHQFSTQTTGVTFAQITDNTDFPHTGLIKALSLMGKGNMALKGSVTDFDITQATSGNVVVVKSGKIYRDGALHTIPSSGADTNFTSSAFDTSTGGNSYYHLLVADSSNTLQIRKHGISTADKVPEYTEGDTIIAVIMFNSSTAALGSMQIQFLTTGKFENSLSIGYSTGSSPNQIYNEAGSLTGDSNGITMTGLYKLDTLPTATVATDDKVIIQDTDDSDKIKTVLVSALSGYTDADAVSAVEAVTGTLALTGDVTIAAGKDLTVDTNSLVVDAANDRVGIGIAAPQHRLDIVETTDNFPFRLRGNEGNIRINKYGHIQIQNENASDSSTIDDPIWQIAQRDGGQFDISFGNIATQLVAASDAILSLSRASSSATGNKQMGFFGATAVDRVSVGNISSSAVINPDVPSSASAAEITSTQAAITALENKLDALIDALQLYGLIL